VIRDPAVHHRVLEDVLAFAQSEGYAVRGLIRSPLLGPKGNVEFLAWLDLSGRDTVDLAVTIEGVIVTSPGNLERR
jgi:23S rRNA (cytidine1920-2'-O)/16S rRNA (cytidine1409-2'-O)-methyltransferase